MIHTDISSVFSSNENVLCELEHNLLRNASCLSVTNIFVTSSVSSTSSAARVTTSYGTCLTLDTHTYGQTWKKIDQFQQWDRHCRSARQRVLCSRLGLECLSPSGEIVRSKKSTLISHVANDLVIDVATIHSSENNIVFTVWLFFLESTAAIA